MNDQEKKIISIPEIIIIKELAEKMNLPVMEVIAELMKNGIMSSMNESIDFETATIIAEDLGFIVKKLESSQAKDQEKDLLLEALKEKNKREIKPRPPIVVVMGHVDHGKTKLLDAIKETNVVEKEVGGITQSIGACQIKDRGKLITLIDTPGHEAFSAMRSRGTKVADIAILVVAADDGVKLQTKEALNIIQKAKIPFLVAINKIDKPEANIEKVKKELVELGLVPEEWGGKTIIVPVSAKKKLGLTELLDMIFLITELEKKNIVANPNREAIGTVIESHIDKGAGPQATVLIQTGTLKLGDAVIVGETYGKIKTLTDWRGHSITEARPSQPVLVLGLKGAPQVGDILHVTCDPSEIKKMVKKQRLYVIQKKAVRQIVRKKGEEGEEDEEEEKKKKIKKFNIILKTDTLGSQEAIIESLEKMKNQEVALVITAKGLGNITEKDILKTDSAKSVLVGFNVTPTTQAQEVQKDRNVTIKIFNLIYELIDFIKRELEKLLPPEIIQIDLGKIEILALFKIDKDYQIVGGKVINGKVEKETKVRIIRKGEKIGLGQIGQLQSDKKNVKEVLKDNDCGLKIKSATAIQEKDVLEIYREEQKPRKLEF